MTPVVLLGGLNIVRALGMAGIPVIIASSSRRTPSQASRYCTGVIELPPISERDAVVQTLVHEGRRLTEKHGAAVPLFYDNDDRLALVQDYRAALAPHFALLLNDPALADALVEKTRFQALGERTGLPVPRRFDWESLASAAGPVLAKPRTRTGWDHSSVRRQLFGGAGKARIFASGREARAEIAALGASLAGQLSFQEYVPGGDDAIWSFHGFAAPGGEVLEWFVGRKIRTWPALTGDSSYLGLARDERLVSLGRDIARQLRLAGIFKMDFKRSASSGRYYLLEINTRFNLWHYLGARSGVNLAHVAYEYLLHERRPLHAEVRSEARWLHLHYDLRAYRELSARGELTLAQWLRSIAHFPMVYDLFSWSDPLPFVRHWAKKIRSAFTPQDAPVARYGVLGDIHGNREALEAVLRALEERGVRQFLCVGDIVGYNADPDECVALLRSRRVAAIAGNHDLISQRRLDFSRCSNIAEYALRRTRRTLGKEAAAFLSNLPAHLLVEKHVLLVHGGVRDVQQYMVKPAHIRENAQFLAADHPGARVCFFGHSHEQRVYEIDGDTVTEVPTHGEVLLRKENTYFINPGSVDASRKSRHKLAECALFDSAFGTVEFLRVRYDAAATEAKAAAFGYRISPLADRLYNLKRRSVSLMRRGR